MQRFSEQNHETMKCKSFANKIIKNLVKQIKEDLYNVKVYTFTVWKTISFQFESQIPRNIIYKDITVII